MTDEDRIDELEDRLLDLGSLEGSLLDEIETAMRRVDDLEAKVRRAKSIGASPRRQSYPCSSSEPDKVAVLGWGGIITYHDRAEAEMKERTVGRSGIGYSKILR